MRTLPLLALLLVPAFADDPIPADTEVKSTASGLKYCVLKEAAGGARPKENDTVRVHYTGWLVDGKVFDSSRARGQPAQFAVGGVIEGWREGLRLMTVGSRFKFTIPPELGYGPYGSPPDIPGGATLIFDVELLEILSPPEFRNGNPEKQKTTASGLKWEPIVEGEGNGPGKGDGCELKFALWNATGKLIDCSEVSGFRFQGSPAGLPLGILREAATLMKPGARYRFEAPHALAFGARPVSPDLPPFSPTVWELEMVRVIALPPFVAPDESKQTTTKSGLKYEVMKEGEGRSPTPADKVSAHYVGWLPDGTVFDSSHLRGAPLEFQLGQVIRGWGEGLQLMKPGAVYRFVIPAELAYGANGSPPAIPPNQTLIFQVELVKVG